MKLIIESTNQVVALNGVPCRVWTGQTDKGVPIHCFIPSIAVREDQDCSQFEQELQELPEPLMVSLRMALDA